MNSKKNEYKSHTGGDTTQDATENKEPEIPKPIFDASGKTFFQKSVNNIIYFFSLMNYYFKKYILSYIKENKKAFTFIVLLIIYLCLMIFVFTKNPMDVINDNNEGFSIFMALFGGFILLMGFFFFQRKKELFENEKSEGELSYFGKILTTMGLIGLTIFIILFTFTLMSNYNDFSKYLIYGLNVVIFVGLISIALKYFGFSGGEPGPPKEPSMFRLLGKIIFYIPCLLIDFAEYVKYQYKITSPTIVLLLLGEIIFIAMYFLLPYLIQTIITHNAEQLIKDPINLNNEKSLGTFQEINYVNDQFSYHYAISSWIYIDSFPPETNSSYDEYTSLLNIGNKPNILFNVAKNKLKIMLESQAKKQEILFESTDFRMQKWNNIIINYDGATLDIFINGSLVSSKAETIPYLDNTTITSGTNNGLFGGVCNVMYFKDNISMGKINWLYNSFKDLNPPII